MVGRQAGVHPGLARGKGCPSSTAGHQSEDAAAGSCRTLRSKCWSPNLHPRSLRPLTLPGVLRWGGPARCRGVGGRTSVAVPRSQKSSWGLAAGSGPLGSRVCMCMCVCTHVHVCTCVHLGVRGGSPEQLCQMRGFTDQSDICHPRWLQAARLLALPRDPRSGASVTARSSPSLSYVCM